MIGNKKVLAVVTARKGSKGIPGKNYRDLLGKPLFIWSMLAGLQSKYVDRVVVSSNCPEVKKIFCNFIEPTLKKMAGLPIRERYEEYPFNKLPFFIDRPDEISEDLSKNEDALIHALKFYKERHEVDYGIVVNLQPTSPFRPNKLIDRCLEKYVSGGYNSLLTGAKDTPFLWQKKNGKWEYTVDVNGCCNRKMRQEFDDTIENSEFVWHDNGCIYIVDKEILLKTECRIGDKPCVFETKGLENIQIDKEFDFELIEQLAKVKGLTTLI